MCKNKDIELLKKIKKGKRLNSKDLNSNPNSKNALENLTEDIKVSYFGIWFKNK